MPSASQCTALAGCAVLAGAIAWLALARHPVAQPGQPTTVAGPLQVLEAAVPAIGGFGEFEVNRENPFIPLAQRQLASHSTATAGSTGMIIIRPPAPAGRQLPTIAAADVNGPAITGVVRSHQGAQALITFPGEAHATVMAPGDTAHGWTLLDIVGGSAVHLRENGSGATRELIIPAPAASRAPAKARDGAHRDTAHGADTVARNLPAITTANREL